MLVVAMLVLNVLDVDDSSYVAVRVHDFDDFVVVYMSICCV